MNIFKYLSMKTNTYVICNVCNNGNNIHYYYYYYKGDTDVCYIGVV